MKHLHDLSFKELKEVVDAPFLDITEKIDGSYFEFGIDKHGFYSKPKFKKIYRHYHEYDQTWQNYYRAAHNLAEQYITRNNIKEICYFKAEIVGCSTPNITYYSASNKIYIFDSSLNVVPKRCFLFTDYDFYYSKNGKAVNKKRIVGDAWEITFLQKHKFDHIGLFDIVKQYIQDNEKYLSVPLNKKLPDGLTKKDVVKKRTELYNILTDKLFNMNLYFEIQSQFNFLGQWYVEGFVFNIGSVTFKIQNPIFSFRERNDTFHSLQNQIYGRTAIYDGSLKHLKEIRNNYLKHYYRNKDMHSRALLLLATEWEKHNGWKRFFQYFEN